jgi:hypothetical protein
VSFEGAPGGPFAGDIRFRGVRDFEHGTLCRVFGLDTNRFFFDLPSTVRGIGPNTRGAGGSLPSGRRRISGFVMMAGRSEPVAKITVTFADRRFKDVDPEDARDFFDLSHS